MRSLSHHVRHILALALALLVQLQLPGSLSAVETTRAPRNPYAPKVSPAAAVPQAPAAAPRSPGAGSGPAMDPLSITSAATDPLGEWYAVGHRMAEEALPSYLVLSVPEKDLGRRLIDILSALGIKTDTQLKNTELKLLQQGWDDAIAGKAPALTYPPEQPGSILPAALRGFHQFRKTGPAPGTETLADKAAEWKRAVVKVISGNDGKANGHGTGFLIGPGLILTNNHVVEGSAQFAIQLEEDKSLHDAVLIAKQTVPDVALLRVALPEGHATLPIGISAQCRELEEVIMIGYPKFIEYSATYVKGAISSTDRVILDCQVLQLDIRSNPGNSGGPVISTDGHVVGILTFGAKDAKLAQFTYAIKVDTVIPFLEQNAPGLYVRQEQ